MTTWRGVVIVAAAADGSDAVVCIRMVWLRWALTTEGIAILSLLRPAEPTDDAAPMLHPRTALGQFAHPGITRSRVKLVEAVRLRSPPAAMPSRCAFDRHVDTATERLEGGLELIQS